jgi:general secretion pathway protein G
MILKVQRARRRSAGFTLIELLIVVALIGILTGVAVGNYKRSLVKARESVLRENLWIMRSLINQYFADKGQYPMDLYALVEDKYLVEIPEDPITGSRDSWVTEAADFGEGDISQEPGIGYVRSGAEGVDSNGTAYSDY